ncbi:hypothetical protein HDU67_009288 [Dinochytrium kinnereticum]|nr:hypothetical protein HDU67_009288 [Dinochytrium kinnereticum]
MIDLSPSDKTDTKCSFAHLAFTFPLRLISPTAHPDTPLHRSVYMLSYGGGLLANDEICLDVRVKGKCSLSLLTQGSTKVFKMPRQLDQPLLDGNTHEGLDQPLSTIPKPVRLPGAHQKLSIRIGPEALVCVLPEPVVPFADSSFSQTQTIYLDSITSSLVLLDWVTAGRVSRGESWDFQKYESRISVRLGARRGGRGREILRDAWLLEDEGLKTDMMDVVEKDKAMPKVERSYMARVKPYECIATLLLIGPRAQKLAQSAISEFENVKVSRNHRPTHPVFWSLSPIQELSSTDMVLEDDRSYGVVLRISGKGSLEVREFIKARLVGLEDEIGEDLFSKHI